MAHGIAAACVRRKSTSVIGDDELEGRVADEQSHCHAGRVGVPNDIGECFLRRAKQGQLRFRCESRCRCRKLDGHDQSAAFADITRQRFDRRHQSKVVEQGGAQVVHHAPDAANAVVYQVQHVIQPADRIRFGTLAEHADFHLHSRERLRGFVVKVSRKSPALGFMLPHHQRGKAAEFVGTRSESFGEFRQDHDAKADADGELEEDIEEIAPGLPRPAGAQHGVIEMMQAPECERDRHKPRAPRPGALRISPEHPSGPECSACDQGHNRKGNQDQPVECVNRNPRPDWRNEQQCRVAESPRRAAREHQGGPQNRQGDPTGDDLVPEEPDQVAGAQEKDYRAESEDVESPRGCPPGHPALLQSAEQHEREAGKSRRHNRLEDGVGEFGGSGEWQRLWHHPKRAVAAALGVGARFGRWTSRSPLGRCPLAFAGCSTTSE